MAGIGPFIPHPDTPLKDEDGRAFQLSLRTMAIMRLLLPDINIPATTAMETLHPDGRIIALQCGANVIMPNVTEGEYRQLYQLYPGKAGLNETPLHSKTSIGARIEAIGAKSVPDTETAGNKIRPKISLSPEHSDDSLCRHVRI